MSQITLPTPRRYESQREGIISEIKCKINGRGADESGGGRWRRRYVNEVGTNKVNLNYNLNKREI